MTTHASEPWVDWGNSKGEPPGPRRPLRRVVTALLTVLLIGGIAIGVRWLYHRYAPHPGPAPAMVSQRSKLSSCGHYQAWWGQIPAPPTYRPSAAVLAANRCLTAAFDAGRPAELTVSSGPDDIQHTGKSFYRVVGLRSMEVIWEDIPPSGPIRAAKLSNCKTLTDVNGQIGASDCHPSGPVYG